MTIFDESEEEKSHLDYLNWHQNKKVILDEFGNPKSGVASVARSKSSLRDLKVTAVCAFSPETPVSCVTTRSHDLLYHPLKDSDVAVDFACETKVHLGAGSLAQIWKVDALVPLAHASPNFRARSARPEHRTWHVFQHPKWPMLEPSNMLEVLARVYYTRDFSERPRTFLSYLDRHFATILAPSGGRTGIREPGTPEGIVPTCYCCTSWRVITQLSYRPYSNPILGK